MISELGQISLYPLMEKVFKTMKFIRRRSKKKFVVVSGQTSS